MSFPSRTPTGAGTDAPAPTYRGSLETARRAGPGPDRDRDDPEGDAADHETVVLEPVGEDPRRTDRWAWALGLAVLLVAAGLVTRAPSLLAAAVVPLAVVAYGAVTGLPPVELTVEREVGRSATAPGEPVPVAVTLTNDGEATLADVRVVDLVPSELPVVDGTPRAAVGLAPGESATVEYEVGARRGTHEFDGVRIRVRNPAGSAVAEGTVRAASDRTLECELPVEDVPLAQDTVLHPGAVSADEHGEGIEFYAVREYRRGDDPTDIDWRRYARTGELTTVRYREERAATVVLVVDARDDTYVSATASTPSAARLSAFAAERAFEALARSHHDVGLATLRGGDVTYVDPGSDPSTITAARDAIRAVYDREPLLSVTSSANRSGEASTALQHLEQRLPGRSQVVLLSPAIDRFTDELVRGLRAHGRPVTVVSPNVATERAAAQEVVAAERAVRLLDLRAAGARVVEWDREEPLPLVLDRATSWGGRP